MRKRIHGEDRAGPGHLEHLQDKQADRPAAEHRNRLQKSGLRKIDRVDGDPERFEHHDVGWGEALRDGDDQLAVDPDALGHRTVMGRCSNELDVRAQVLVSRPAMLATAASTVGVDGDERAARQPAILEILGQPTSELVSGNERLFNCRSPDPSVLVVVKIAAADPNCRDIEKRLAGPAFAKIVRGHAGVPRRMNKECSRHGSPKTARAPTDLTDAYKRREAAATRVVRSGTSMETISSGSWRGYSW